MTPTVSVDGNASITGVGFAPFSRDSGVTAMDLAVRASTEAIQDAGLSLSDIGGLVCFHENDGPLTRDLAAAAGFSAMHWWSDQLAGGNYACAAIGEAAMAIANGHAQHILVYRALNGRSGSRLGRFRLDSAGGVRQFMLPYGFGSPPAVFGMLCRRYMHETGVTREQLATVAISQREYACQNERALRREPLSRADYFEARLIAEPLGLFDCCQETDGACAVVVSDRSATPTTTRTPITVAAVIAGVGHMGRYPFEQWTDLTRSWLAPRADELFHRAGMERQDIDVAELYDAFTFEILMQLEGLGFCGWGEGGDYIDEHGVGPDAPMPINTHGGLLSEGYVQGLNHVCEAVLQLRGECGLRQVAGARTALVTSFGFGSGSAMILVGE